MIMCERTSFRRVWPSAVGASPGDLEAVNRQVTLLGRGGAGGGGGGGSDGGSDGGGGGGSDGGCSPLFHCLPVSTDASDKPAAAVLERGYHDSRHRQCRAVSQHVTSRKHVLTAIPRSRYSVLTAVPSSMWSVLTDGLAADVTPSYDCTDSHSADVTPSYDCADSHSADVTPS